MINKLLKCIQFFSVIAISILIMTSCSSKQAESEITYVQITMDEAAAMMEAEEGYVILDVRTMQEYSEGHIKDAVCIPNETIGTDEIPELPDKNQRILIYCRSGNRSKQAAEKLVLLGYTNIVEFGGIIDWTGEIITE